MDPVSLRRASWWPAWPAAGLLVLLGASCSLSDGGSQGSQAPQATERVGTASQALNPTCFTIERGVSGNVQDSMIDAHDVDTNYGSALAMATAKFEQSLVRFDLSAVSVGTTVTSATFNVWAYGGGNLDTRPVDFYAITAPWNEGTVTYGNFNEAYDSSTIYGTIPSRAKVGYNAVDLTALVGKWVSGALADYGVLLATVPQNNTAADDWATSEAGTAYAPQLVVCYTCAPGWGDCDGIASNGCETNLDTNANCGACGQSCAAPDVCNAGACAAATCNTNADCPPTGSSCVVDACVNHLCVISDGTFDCTCTGSAQTGSFCGNGGVGGDPGQVITGVACSDAFNTCEFADGTCPSLGCNSVCEHGWTCTPNLPQSNGSACAAANQCASGQCVDGVCCDTACTGTCQSCNVPGSVGICANVPNGQPDPSSCAAPSVCNGAGGCTATCNTDADCPSTGNSCMVGACVSHHCVVSDGTFDCTCTGSAQTGNFCGNGGVGGDPGQVITGVTCSEAFDTCEFADGTCPSLGCNSVCEHGWTCTPNLPKPNGSACTAASQCASGQCIGGICCGSALYTCTCTGSAQTGPFCGNGGVGGDPGQVITGVACGDAFNTCEFADGTCPSLGCNSACEHGWTCTPSP
jgi:hypothetical protein